MKPLQSRTAALLFTLVLLLAPLAVEATISRAIAFDEKVDGAAAIVLGRCVSQHSQWDAEREWILTYSTFSIEKTLKGFPSQEITIVTPGGRVGDIVQEVVGVPRFQRGDERVVFVRNTASGPTVLYLEQGAYQVFEDDRGERIVKPLAPTAAVMDTQRGAVVEAERARPLREFETSVRDTIRRREAIRMEMLERQKKEETSVWSHVQRNRILVALALLGVALATWHFVRRS
jgi:hypothetical protein